jgi:integrase/recombinase XerC
VSVRYRVFQQFFKWLVIEEEIDRSPMDTRRPPTVPDHPVGRPTDADIRAVLKACVGTGVRRPA